MTPEVRVSIVIPCHNREKTVGEAVTSVLDQTVPEIEIIAVDDRSDDGTVSVLEMIQDSRLSIRTNERPRGPSGARNHGASFATAEWIAFQDSDDIWLPEKLAEQLKKAASGNHVAIYCGMLVKEDAHPDTPVQTRHPPRDVSPLEGDILRSLVRQSFVSTQMLMVRRDVFEAVGGFDEGLPVLVDWELMLRVAQRGSIAFVDQDLVIQRMSSNSVTHATRKRLSAQSYILAKHRELIAQYPEAHAHHHHRLAGGYRTFGDFKTAKGHAAEAVKLQPKKLKYLINLLYLCVKSLRDEKREKT